MITQKDFDKLLEYQNEVLSHKHELEEFKRLRDRLIYELKRYGIEELIDFSSPEIKEYPTSEASTADLVYRFIEEMVDERVNDFKKSYKGAYLL